MAFPSRCDDVNFYQVFYTLMPDVGQGLYRFGSGSNSSSHWSGGWGKKKIAANGRQTLASVR